MVNLNGYQRYPITLITYAACLGATLSKNFDFISALSRTNLKKKDIREKRAIDIVPPFRMLQHSMEWGRLLEGMDGRYTPLNDWLHDTLFNCLGEYFSSSDEFTLAFDTVEIFLALAFGKHSIGNAKMTPKWFPPGCYCYRYDDNQEPIITEINNSLNMFEAESPYVKSSLFGDSADECREQLKVFTDFINELN